jgi:hypothetical protein
MNQIIDAVVEEFEKFNDSIIQTLAVKKINDTKEAARSLEVKHGRDFVQSLGIFYIEFLDTGRGPGEKPPWKPILEWAMRRTGQTASEVWGLAVYVQEKIAEIGTNIFINNKKGLEIDKKIVTLRKAVNEAISEEMDFILEKKLDRFKKKFTKINFEI